MKILFLVLGLVLTNISVEAQAKSINSNEVRIEVSQKVNALQAIIIRPKLTYKSSDKITLPVLLVNSGKTDIYVFGTLGWGHSASLILHVRDAAGNEIEPIGFPDDQTHFSRDDNSAFVKLIPNHFLGTNFFAPLNILNLNRPGRYTVWVEYHCPISTDDVSVRPFWGSESGTIKSNAIQIDVVR